MNIGKLETTLAHAGAADCIATDSLDELTRAKRELMRAEVRLAKARGAAALAEVDIKVLSARLKALVK